VLDGSTQKVAVDAVGCIPGDWVICVGSSAAREAAGSKSYPSDLTIVGIIDHWDPDAGKAPVKSETTATTASLPKTETTPSVPPAGASSTAEASAPSANGGGKV